LGPRRKDVLIVTKGGVQTRPGQMANHPAPEGIRDSRAIDAIMKGAAGQSTAIPT
jgi:hypothetical protein